MMVAMISWSCEELGQPRGQAAARTTSPSGDPAGLGRVVAGELRARPVRSASPRSRGPPGAASTASSISSRHAEQRPADALDAGLLAQLADHRLGQGLAALDPPPGTAQVPRRRPVPASDQQQVVVVDARRR